jgi:uncharacterized protein
MDQSKTDFIGQKSLAVVGISSGRGFANMAYAELKKKGYQLFGVSRTATTVDGDPCYLSLDELPQVVGGALIIVPPVETEKIVADCARLGIKHLWLQQGSASEQAIQLATEQGLKVVHHACIMMYAQPSGFHGFHAWLWKVLGKL